MQFGKHSIGHGLLCIIFILLIRKLWLGYLAMSYVDSFKDQVSLESMKADKQFISVIESLSSSKPTLILILNKHALNMTLNWLCNTQHMTDVHRQALIVTLDRNAYEFLSNVWRNVKCVLWNTPSLQIPFNYGDGQYQLFYLFRATLAQLLVECGKPFWMIQQDTFWQESIFVLNIAESENTDLLFDRAGENLGSLIAGGYYMAKPTSGSLAFFRQLSSDLSWRYTPDNTYMASLCSMSDKTHCDYIPFWMITNWLWIYEPSRSKSDATPLLIQFDGDTKLGGKLNKMKQLGFYFLSDDGVTCNASAVEDARRLVLSRSVSNNAKKSYSHYQFGFYTILVDFFYKSSITEVFLNKIVYPNAHYFMITL